jgi:hypothetical protein
MTRAQKQFHNERKRRQAAPAVAPRQPNAAQTLMATFDKPLATAPRTFDQLFSGLKAKRRSHVNH